MKNYRFMHTNKMHSRSDEGLTSVIVTVAIIAIVMGFIVGPYLLVIIPQQIESNEAAHRKEVEKSFYDLRAAINDEVADGSPNTVLSTKLKLGTDDENLFVVGGGGSLIVDPSDMTVSINNYYDPLSVYARGSGNIRYSTKNFYHSDSTLIYENGGVVVSSKGADVMKIDPDFDLTRRCVISTLGLNAEFGDLSVDGRTLTEIFVINTISTSVSIEKARITWRGGNATLLTSLNIAGGAVEWSGTAASNVLLNFASPYSIANRAEPISLGFNADIFDTYEVIINLYTNDTRTITGTWPVTQFDTVAHAYDFQGATPDIKKFNFKNICTRPTNITNIALNWVGGATLLKISIPGHGGTVWDPGLPGIISPAYIELTNGSLFQPEEKGEVRLHFAGGIGNNDVYIKFFAQNSSNNAVASYPVTLNETYINVSCSLISLVTSTGDDIQTGGKSSKLIKTTLVSAEDNRYIWNKGESLEINMTTPNGEAWLDYLNTTMVKNTDIIYDIDGPGPFPGEYYITSTEGTDELTHIQMVLYSVYKLDCLIGVIKVEVG